MDQIGRRQEAYEGYLAALEQFEIEFPPETPPVSAARQRREAGAADTSVRFAMPPRQPSSVDPALRQQIFQNSSLLVNYDPLASTLASIQKENPAPSGTQFADDEVEDYGDDDGELGYTPPLHDFQPGSDWYDPNQGGYYQPHSPVFFRTATMGLAQGELDSLTMQSFNNFSISIFTSSCTA